MINYTQRRYIWIDDWLIRRFHVDPARININGHSLGAKGAGAIAKAFPDHYASATMFNTGLIEDDPPVGSDIFFGSTALNFPTSLVNRDGQTIGFTNLMNITGRNALQRDLPLLRVFHGKNDDDSGSKWDTYVVDQFFEADSIGWGVQVYWGQRGHGINTGPDYNDHWHNGNTETQQTRVDNVIYEEAYFRSDKSFPAFFNHHLDPQNNDPGDGTPSTGPNGVGDDWGTWGGYHRWDWDNVKDLPTTWSVVTWLESEAVYGNDRCPVSSLTADLAIRKPKQFKPATGSLLNWSVKTAFGNTVQSGQVTVQADGLVVIPKVVVFKQNIHPVRITVTNSDVPVSEPEHVSPAIKIIPNPSFDDALLSVFSQNEMDASVFVRGLDGQRLSMTAHFVKGENLLPLTAFANLPTGFYFITVSGNGLQQVVKWVKM